MEDDGIATHQETMATTAGEPIELLQSQSPSATSSRQIQA